MALENCTREWLIHDLVRGILDRENKPAAEVTRAYMLDLVAEVAAAVDGQRKSSMKISREALDKI